MPVLDAKALRTDRKGLAFLRAVLGFKRPKRPPVPSADAPRGAKGKGEPAAPKPPHRPVSRPQP